MRLCLVTPDYPSARSGSGVGSQVRALGHGLEQAGHRVRVLALANPQTIMCAEPDNVERTSRGNLHWYVYKTPWMGGLLALVVRELEDALAFYQRARQLHREEPFDLIEGTESGMLLIALWMREVPLVIRMHGEHYTFHKYTPDLPLTAGLRLSRLLQRAALRRARMLIAPSTAHANEIAAELRGSHPPIRVVPNLLNTWPIDDRLDDNASTCALQVSIPKGAPIVLYVGRLERCKGIPILLAAAKQVIATLPSTRFVLAGASHPTLSKTALQQLIRDLGLHEHVLLLGHVAWEQLKCWYQRAAICVLPSFYETFGLAALEAMAWGIPVVATKVGGIPEIIEHGQTGLLVRPGDTDALAKALVELLQDPQQRQSMGQMGYKRAHAVFSQERAVRETLAVYSHVLSSGF